MNRDGLRWLLTDAGQALLGELCADPAVSEANFLRYATRLRKTHPADGVAAALETAILRRAAGAKFPAADRMYFTREALEQATPHAVAAYRAGRFAGCGKVADLACSLGGDALPLAAIAPVLAVDRDELRLDLLRANAAALGLADRVEPLLADLATVDCAGCDGLFFDPARREGPGGRRIWDVEQYLPPLSTIHAWRGRVPLRAAKVAPGIPDDQVPAGCDLEFVSLDGDLREATLWWDNRAAGPRGERRAILLSSRDPEVRSLAADPATPPPQQAAPGRFLYEPDPAVIRAHAVADLAQVLGAAQIDADIAYLTADDHRPSPFARAWQIEHAMPFNLKALRRALQERQVGSITVKKRGSPITPEQLTRQLRLDGPNHQIVVLTQVADAPTVLLCRPLADA